MPLPTKQFLRNLAGLEDSPHKIALGLALGIFIGFLPIMGIQMAAVLPFAILFRGNKTAAIGGVWISNPLTFIPIYYMNYQVGLLFSSYHRMTWEHFTELFEKLDLSSLIQLGKEILIPLILGSFIVAIVSAVPTYFVTRLLVSRYHKRQARLTASK